MEAKDLVTCNLSVTSVTACAAATSIYFQDIVIIPKEGGFPPSLRKFWEEEAPGLAAGTETFCPCFAVCDFKNVIVNLIPDGDLSLWAFLLTGSSSRFSLPKIY